MHADGPVVQCDGAGGLFYRYAMSYTACPLAGEPGSWTATGRRLLNHFIENAHGGSAGFDCGQIVGDLHGGALSAGFGNDCGRAPPNPSPRRGRPAAWLPEPPFDHHSAPGVVLT